MPKIRMELEGGLADLHDFFIKALEGAKFHILAERIEPESIRVLGVNRKRTSHLTSTIFSIIGGYIEKNRIGIELLARKKGDTIEGDLRCSPYLSNFDMEVVAEGKELEKCRDILNFFQDKIKTEYSK